MDITSLFKASVKTVRLKLKNLPVPDKNRILTKKAPKSEFYKRAQDIKFQISQLKNFLIDNRSAYMQFAYHLKSSAHMTDDERDIIDRESEKIIAICTELIEEFKEDCRKKKATEQTAKFMDVVLEALADYMASVRNIFKEQKNFRIQRELETYKLLKLNSDKRNLAPMPVGPEHENRIKEQKRKIYMEDEDDDDAFNESSSLLDKSKSSVLLPQDEEEISRNASFLDDEELSPEDIQIFESENMQLYNELKGLSEEVEQIQKTVVDIAQLQNIFTEKISLQKYDIDRIANTVVGSTENMKDANEQIKQAIQRNAGLRVWVLFFLIVMSLSLLFLDWYND